MDLEIIDLYLYMFGYIGQMLFDHRLKSIRGATVIQKDASIAIRVYCRRYNGDWEYVYYYLIDQDVGRIIFVGDDIQKLE